MLAHLVKCFPFLSHKTDFLQKYLIKTITIKLNFIEQVCLQNFLIKQGNF